MERQKQDQFQYDKSAEKTSLIKSVCDRVDHYISIDRVSQKNGLIDHRDRLILTILRLRNIIEMTKARSVFVLGSASTVEFVIWDLNLCPGTAIHHSKDLDLRYPLTTIETSSYDMVIATEVIEHIKDQNESRRDMFTFSGLRCLLKECNRILKPKGVLFLTTPNAASRKAIVRLLLGKSPLSWYPHVREYTAEELIGILMLYNFHIEVLETHELFGTKAYPLPFDFNYLSKGNSGEEVNFDWLTHEDIFKIVESIDSQFEFNDELRGDTIYIHARKIAEVD